MEGKSVVKGFLGMLFLLSIRLRRQHHTQVCYLLRQKINHEYTECTYLYIHQLFISAQYIEHLIVLSTSSIQIYRPTFIYECDIVIRV